MAIPTSSMTSVEMLEEARDIAYRLVDLLTTLEGRVEGAWPKHIATHLTLKAKEIEYFLPEIN